MLHGFLANKNYHTLGYNCYSSTCIGLPQKEIQAILYVSHFHFSTGSKTLNELLLELHTEVDETIDPNTINVARSRLLGGACRAFKKTRFQARSRMSVMFMDDVGQSEGAIDTGGPTHEFFTLLFHKFMENGMFDGTEEKKMIVPSDQGEQLAYSRISFDK
jgi:hypothetical protein